MLLQFYDKRLGELFKRDETFHLAEYVKHSRPIHVALMVLYLIIVSKLFILNFHCGLQNANMSVQKKSSGGPGRTKVLAAGVDGVAIPSADENGGEDSEVCSVFHALKFNNNP